MTTGNIIQPGGGGAARSGGAGSAPANLGDILERVLDKGLVIAGDIQINLLDIELLTIKLRLVIASLDTAREVGINWWETDPWLSADAGRRAARDAQRRDGELEAENRQLQRRIRELESSRADGPSRPSRPSRVSRSTTRDGARDD